MLIRTSKHGASLLLLLLSACRGNANGEVPLPTSSPQAKAEPAPLASPAAAIADDAGLVLRTNDGGLLQGPLALDTASIPDSLSASKDTSASYTLSAILRPLDPPPVARGAEVNAVQLEQARKKLESRYTIDVGAGRMRWVLDGPGHLIADNVELRDRSDKWGHLFLFSHNTRYRTAAVGSLRSFFQEGRYDVMPLLPAKTVLQGVNYRLGYRTRMLEVSTAAGRVTIEVAKLADVVDGGQLVCQALFEWVRALPQMSPCALDEVPLHAEFHWLPRGAATFEVTRLHKRDASHISELACPPASSEFSTEAPPRATGRTYLSESELSQLHQAIEIPIAKDAPRGLLAINNSSSIRVLWADGIPIAQVLPSGSHLIVGLARGRYQVQWRTPEGASEPGASVLVPGRTEMGYPDPSH